MPKSSAKEKNRRLPFQAALVMGLEMSGIAGDYGEMTDWTEKEQSPTGVPHPIERPRKGPR